MNKSVKVIFNRSTIIAAKTALFSVILSTSVHAGSLQDSGIKILEAHFEARNVVQVEAGDFHFKPGQIAPVHTHTAPAVGYVVKGEIIYQVEGEKQLILREGDAFYEPAGPRILRFDNASATEEAIFVDFNLEQEGEPFIVFEKPPTEAIDRRTLPTTKMATTPIKNVDIFKHDLLPGEVVSVANGEPAMAIVATGVVIVKRKGEASKRLVTGSTFALTGNNAKTEVINASSETPAKVITFQLL
ncbi:MAG: cupin domain-containing protein [Pseudomonadales bacterium]|jgi:quercetin dioxygenase-like cupin family protein